MCSTLQRFIKNESGATAIEYSLIAGLISVVIVAALTSVGAVLNTKFTSLKGGLN